MVVGWSCVVLEEVGGVCVGADAGAGVGGWAMASGCDAIGGADEWLLQWLGARKLVVVLLFWCRRF